jgi:hypothetical protein
MKAKFFYLVSESMFRYKNDETRLINVHEVFVDDDPIIARENAFGYFQSYIDVFLESRGEVFTTHEMAVEIIQDFVNSYRLEYHKTGDVLFKEVNADFDKGLSICLVLSDAKTITLADGSKIYLETHPIHYIDNEFTDYKTNVFSALQFEYSLYSKYNYDCKNYKKVFNISKLTKVVNFVSILNTPIDFNKVLASGFSETYNLV